MSIIVRQPAPSKPSWVADVIERMQRRFEAIRAVLPTYEESTRREQAIMGALPDHSDLIEMEWAKEALRSRTDRLAEALEQHRETRAKLLTLLGVKPGSTTLLDQKRAESPTPRLVNVLGEVMALAERESEAALTELRTRVTALEAELAAQRDAARAEVAHLKALAGGATNEQIIAGYERRRDAAEAHRDRALIRIAVLEGALREAARVLPAGYVRRLVEVALKEDI